MKQVHNRKDTEQKHTRLIKARKMLLIITKWENRDQIKETIPQNKYDLANPRVTEITFEACEKKALLVLDNTTTLDYTTDPWHAYSTPQPLLRMYNVRPHDRQIRVYLKLSYK